MTEFKVSPERASNQSHDRRTRLILWGAVLLLVGIALFALYGAQSVGPEVNTVLAVAAVIIVMGVGGSAYFLAGWAGLERAKLSTVFLLTNGDLVRQRLGWPDVRIGLSEVGSVRTCPGWLVVESAEPRRRIAIPDNVEGFDNLRSELVKHGPIVKSPRRSPFFAVPLIASFFCWALVLLSKEPGVVKTAGCLAVVLLAWDSFRVGRMLSHSPKRYLLWAVFAFSWAAALCVIYAQLARL